MCLHNASSLVVLGFWVLRVCAFVLVVLGFGLSVFWLVTGWFAGWVVVVLLGGLWFASGCHWCFILCVRGIFWLVLIPACWCGMV